MRKKERKSPIEKIKIEGAGETDSLHSYQYNEYDKIYIGDSLESLGKTGREPHSLGTVI
jgi:hypothetical protein